VRGAFGDERLGWRAFVNIMEMNLVLELISQSSVILHFLLYQRRSSEDRICFQGTQRCALSRDDCILSRIPMLSRPTAAYSHSEVMTLFFSIAPILLAHCSGPHGRATIPFESKSYAYELGRLPPLVRHFLPSVDQRGVFQIRKLLPVVKG
jgi:hypothetical protein